LKAYHKAKRSASYEEKHIIPVLLRPFTSQWYYAEVILNHRLTANHFKSFGVDLNRKNRLILFPGIGSNVLPFLASDKIVEYKTLGVANGATQFVPMFVYNAKGEQIDNISDWALEVFRIRYKTIVDKEEIFHYVYAVLNNPAYRKKYEQNLKREFPRVPFYENFTQWVAWGKTLMDLHINYEAVTPYPLKTIDVANKLQPKPKLKALKDAGVIQLDENTELHCIPVSAWEYKLGNRSALEWVLDQYKEMKSSDATIAEKFNTYRFVDYKEQVIDLLKKVCTVSVETARFFREVENL
jgi:predicted helicase